MDSGELAFRAPVRSGEYGFYLLLFFVFQVSGYSPVSWPLERRSFQVSICPFLVGNTICSAGMMYSQECEDGRIAILFAVFSEPRPY